MTADLLAELAASGDFVSAYRALGRHRVFDAFVAPARLGEGCALLEELGFHHRDLGFFISVIAGCGLALPILAATGNDALDGILTGERVAAVAITEPTAGSDALSLGTTLSERDGRLVLSGHKWNITNAPVATDIIAFCYEEPRHQLRAVLVPADAPGVVRPDAMRLIGCLESPTGEIVFDDVTVDPSWVLDADGKTLLDLAFVRERVLAPWPLLGKMAREIQVAIDFVARREQFGKPIASHQYVQDKIVGCYERLSTARLLAERAVAELTAGRPGHAHASLAKYHAADAAVAVFRSLIETYGSRGLQADKRLGHYLNDALCATIAGGTREMHKRVLFDQLMLDRARSRRRGRSKLFAITSEEKHHA